MARIPSNLMLGVTVLFASSARTNAHFQMLLPSAPSGSTDQQMTVTYQWGHPFEHQLFDAPKPESITVVEPDGTRSDLSASARKIDIPGDGGKSVTAFQVTYTPRQRGDYKFTVATPPIWMDEEKLFLQDVVKTLFHVQTQNGWDSAAGLDFEIVPLTRPYGLIPGIVFQAQALKKGKPLAGSTVEVEHYNPKPPKDLPADEQITRSVKTDPNGVFTCTLTEAGWWCVTVERDGGKREHEGKMYPLKQRSTLWVFVDEKPSK
jgi:cobalt/nickel transport protein